MTDTYILKSTEEEFDNEGNLTRRTITEYGFEPSLKWKTPTTDTQIKVGDTWPNGQVYVSGGGEWYSRPVPTFRSDTGEMYTPNKVVYDSGSLHSHPVGGTDRNIHGEVVE